MREVIAAFENGKRIGELEAAQSVDSSTLIEVTDGSGASRRMGLEAVLAEGMNEIAGRWWHRGMATTKAGGVAGSAEALRRLPETLGLGRYLVTDDGEMRKLDPLNSRRFEDGTPAALDGSMGQCMWCWSRAWYFTRWMEGERDVWAISLKPIDGRKSYRIPAGGTSWLGAGVIDRTTGRLCSVISNDERYRGGAGAAVSGKGQQPAADAPQRTMLGMPATCLGLNACSDAARKRGPGWDANWFVAQAAVQILITVLLGERNVQAAFNPERDDEDLMQGGMGAGVTTVAPDWWPAYNNTYPLVPTELGAEAGDRTVVIEYHLPVPEGGGAAVSLQVPCFMGLMHAGYGHLWRMVGGVKVVMIENGSAWVYVSPTMKDGHFGDFVDGLPMVSTMPAGADYIMQLSMEGLCGTPTYLGGSELTYFADYLYGATSYKDRPRIRCAGGKADSKGSVGLFSSMTETGSDYAAAHMTAPLSFFSEDPVVEV